MIAIQGRENEEDNVKRVVGASVSALAKAPPGRSPSKRRLLPSNLSGVAAIVLLITGCASTGPKVIDRHVVPKSLTNVSLENFDAVGSVDVDLHTAVQTREAVESEFKTTYGRTGHQRWFFHAFDVTNLDFVVARYEPTKAMPSRYVAERRIRVKRSNEAELELGVMDVVFSYERSTRGLKVGMSRRDVVKVVGKPETERGLGRSGAFDLRYPAFCVRFVDNRVSHIWRREQCFQ